MMPNLTFWGSTTKIPTVDLERRPILDRPPALGGDLA